MVLPYIDLNLPWVYMCSPSWTHPHLPPHPIHLGHPSAPAPNILYDASNLDWRFISHMIIYMFQCHSPISSHPRPLPQSPKDCSIHLCLFYCLSYRAIVTIFLNSIYMHSVQFSSVQSLSHVWLFATPWIAAHHASLSITNSWSLLKLMSIELVMPSSHLILCRPLLFLPPIPPSIRVFSSESTLCMRWPKCWPSSITPSNEHPGLISFRMDWLDLLAVQGLSRVFSNTTVQKHQLFIAQLSSQSNSHIHTWPLEKP